MNPAMSWGVLLLHVDLWCLAHFLRQGWPWRVIPTLRRLASQPA